MAHRKIGTIEHNGLSARIYRDSDTREYIVKDRTGGTYYTDDLTDANDTALYLLKRDYQLSGTAD